MTDLVVDTSVVIKWYAAHREPDFERARALLVHHTRERCRLHVPMLALYEAGNALRYGTRLSAREQLRCLTDLFALDLSVHPLTSGGAVLAHELCHFFGVSFYDACFAALAQELDTAFVTADEKLVTRLIDFPRVHSLSAFTVE
jgi:predicted nucleic acid-binding protein